MLSIYHRAAGLSSHHRLPQSMYAALAEESLSRHLESTMDDMSSNTLTVLRLQRSWAWIIIITCHC